MKGRNQLPSTDSSTGKVFFMLLAIILTGSIAFSLSSCKHTKAQPQVTMAPNHWHTPPEPKVILERIRKYLVKDEVLYQQLAWDDKGIKIYPRASAKDSGLVETMVPWQYTDRYLCLLDRGTDLDKYLDWGRVMLEDFDCEKPVKPTGFHPTSEQPLKGFRIALDPGHVGGTMAFASMEKKFVRIRKNNRPEIDVPIAFNEGNLALGTALLLRDTLEKLGAVVLLTREREGHCAFDITFEEWLEQETDKAEAASGMDWSRFPGKTIEGYPLRLRNGAAWNWIQQEEIHGKDSLWWMTEATMRDIYKRPFLKADFKRRAAEINAFRPHVSLIIHYNVWEKNTWSSGKYLNAIDDNYTMTFIPGSFMAGELNDPEDRMIFLAKAFSDDIPRSERLSGAVAKGFEKHLEIPVIPYDTSLRYLRAASLPTDKGGVFARNLSLTRLIQGPMCFGEALYQDNVDECRRLNRKEMLLPGMKTRLPARLKDVVNAYVEGVLEYIDNP